MAKPLVVVKVGGRAAEQEERLREMAAEVAALAADRRFLLVHGGGAEVTALSRRLGVEPTFRDGVRQTSPVEMDIVDMVLSGRVNSALVRLLGSCGLAPVGLSGSDGATFAARPLGGDTSGATRTGEVTEIDTRLLDLLLRHGYLPVLSSTSFDGAGRGMNVNADTVAFRVAAAMKASTLLFLSDIPGVLRDGEPIGELGDGEARKLIAAGVIAGGMVPKVTASLEAVARGVGAVVIGQYAEAGSLGRLLAGRSGTRIRALEAP